MKKLLFTLIAASLLLMYLLSLPINDIGLDQELSSGTEYSSIVPAKPPKVPPKE